MREMTPTAGYLGRCLLSTHARVGKRARKARETFVISVYIIPKF